MDESSEASGEGPAARQPFTLHNWERYIEDALRRFAPIHGRTISEQATASNRNTWPSVIGTTGRTLLESPAEFIGIRNSIPKAHQPGRRRLPLE